MAERGRTIYLMKRGQFSNLCSVGWTPGEGVMHLRHGLEISRWDQVWNQRVHFGALWVITHADLAQQTLITANHHDAFHTAW